MPRKRVVKKRHKARSRGKKAKKGNEAQLLVKKWLVSKGYLVHEAKKMAFKSRGRYISLGEDLFGCLDHIAINGEKTWGIQVTTQKGVYARKKKVAEKAPWFPPHWSLVIMVHRSGVDLNQWRIYSHDRDSNTWSRQDIDFDSNLLTLRLEEVEAIRQQRGLPK